MKRLVCGLFAMLGFELIVVSIRPARRLSLIFDGDE